MRGRDMGTYVPLYTQTGARLREKKSTETIGAEDSLKKSNTHLESLRAIKEPRQKAINSQPGRGKKRGVGSSNPYCSGFAKRGEESVRENVGDLRERLHTVGLSEEHENHRVPRRHQVRIRRYLRKGRIRLRGFGLAARLS